MTLHKLTFGNEVIFETPSEAELVLHLRQKFPPSGDFPTPNLLNAGFAIVTGEGERLQGLQASRWIRQHQ